MRSMVFAAVTGIMASAWPLAGGAAPAPAASPSAPVTPAPPVSAEPGSTSATFGDWQLRCQRVGEGAAAVRLCEVAQIIHSQDGRETVAEVALGRLPTDKRLRVTGLLPPNISLPSVVTVGTDDKSASVDMQWRRCLPGGCLADAIPSDDTLKRWRGQTGGGKLLVKDAAGRDVTLPLSFRGLAQALDALDKG